MYAEWLGAPGKPTPVLYGHYDVQPPDPLDEWKSPPFEPDMRNNNIYARGSADDKGQTYIQIKAVEGLLKQHGKLPVNVKFLIEGEEEVGGEHIESYVESKPAAHSKPTPRWFATPRCSRRSCPPSASVCAAWCMANSTCRAPDHDLHSGVYGGAAPNPIRPSPKSLRAEGSRRAHPDSRILRSRASAQRQRSAKLGRACRSTRSEYKEKEIGVEGADRRAWSSAVRARSGRGRRSKCTASAADFTGEGAKTVIPARAMAKISTRLVADQRPDEAIAARTKPLAGEACPKGVTAELKLIHSAPPSLANPDNRFISRRRSDEAGIRQGDGLHPLRRLDSDRRRRSMNTWAFPA